MTSFLLFIIAGLLVALWVARQIIQIERARAGMAELEKAKLTDLLIVERNHTAEMRVALARAKGRT